MNNIRVYKDDDLEVKTESVVTLKLSLFHPNETDAQAARRFVRDALIDFCEAAGLDIYERDDQGNPISIQEEAIIPALEEHFCRQFITLVTAQRQERAARLQAEETQIALMGEIVKRRHEQQAS